MLVFSSRSQAGCTSLPGGAAKCGPQGKVRSILAGRVKGSGAWTPCCITIMPWKCVGCRPGWHVGAFAFAMPSIGPDMTIGLRCRHAGSVTGIRLGQRSLFHFGKRSVAMENQKNIPSCNKNAVKMPMDKGYGKCIIQKCMAPVPASTPCPFRGPGGRRWIAR